MKTRSLNGKNKKSLNKKEFKGSILQVLEQGATRYTSDEYDKFMKEKKKESDRDYDYDDYDDLD